MNRPLKSLALWAAVDRYIADFQKVRLLAQKLPTAELPTLVGLSKSVVEQYIALLRQYEPELALNTQSEPNAVPSDDESVPAPAGTTARRAGRVKGDRRESAAALDSGEHLAIVKQVLEQAAC